MRWKWRSQMSWTSPWWQRGPPRNVLDAKDMTQQHDQPRASSSVNDTVSVFGAMSNASTRDLVAQSRKASDKVKQRLTAKARHSKSRKSSEARQEEVAVRAQRHRDWIEEVRQDSFKRSPSVYDAGLITLQQAHWIKHPQTQKKVEERCAWT